MAKRTKSKKHPKSKPAAQALAPETTENAAPSETAADSLTADPTIAEAPTFAVAEDSEDSQSSPPQVDVATAPFADETVAQEADPADATPEVSTEFGAVWGGDAPPAEASTSDAEPTESAPADTDMATEDLEAAWRGDETATEGSPSEDAPADEPADPTADLADVAENSDGPATDTPEGAEGGEGLAASQLESILESLLFASDKPLGIHELKRLLGERDGKKITAAVEALTDRRKGTGIEVAALSSGWHLRTNPEYAAWVSKLLVGKPVRLSRAMLETLAIVAYRQPVTRPEVDDIRGVDCGPVLKTLLDRGLVRIIGKKEEVGRPMLYGTTPEFLRIFNLRDLSELPTLREFYDLSAEDQSRVESEHGPVEPPSATSPKPDVALNSVMRGALQPEPEDTDPLLDELDEASLLAKQALGDLEPPATEENAGADSEAKSNKTDEEPPTSPPAAE